MRFHVSAWNINGLAKNSLNGDKALNHDFVYNICNCDLFALSETWTHDALTIPNFRCINQPANKIGSQKSGRSSGGIMLFYKESIAKFISKVKSTSYYICCKIEKQLFNISKDVYVCAVYIPPDNSRYFNQELLDELVDDILVFSSMGHLIILGDFNARTGTCDDFIMKEGNKYLPNCQNSKFHEPVKRNSFDNTVNKHGKWLLDLCRTFDLGILNGRTKGDTFGQITSHNRNGVSVVDYIVVDLELLPLVQSFVVRPPNYLSHHSQRALMGQ